MDRKTVLEVKRSDLAAYKKPIYLLAETAYIKQQGKSNRSLHSSESSDVKKCFCSACNTLFDLENDIKIEYQSKHASGNATIYELDNYASNENIEAMKSIKCPNEDCNNTGYYSMLSRLKTPEKKGAINMNDSYVTPYLLQKRELSTETSDGKLHAINDSSDYNSVIIYPSGKIFTRHINYTERTDMDKKTTSLTKSTNMGGKITELYSQESNNLFNQSINMSLSRGVQDNSRLINGIKCNMNIWGQSPNSKLDKELIRHHIEKTDNSVEAIKANKLGTYFTDVIIDLTSEYDTAPQMHYLFMNDEYHYHINEHSLSPTFAMEKRHVLEESFKGKTGAMPFTEAIYLSGLDNKLYMSRISPKATERDFNASSYKSIFDEYGSKFSAYADFMVKYPVAFQFACQQSDEEIRNRAKKTLANKNQDVTDESVQSFIESLPSSAIAKSFRDNFNNIMGQVYHADDKIQTTVQKAASVDEMIANMRYFAFGSNNVNPEITNIKKPSVIKSKTEYTNSLIQNDPELVSAFNKNPIGFANTVYASARLFPGDNEANRYTFIKQAESIIHKNRVLKDQSVFCSTECNTLVMPKSKMQMDMLRGYATIHGPEKMADFFRHEGQSHILTSNLSIPYRIERLSKLLAPYNASLVLYDAPGRNGAPSRLEQAMTIDEFDNYRRLKEYLSTDSTMTTVNKDSVRSAYFDFISVYDDKTKEMVDSCIKDIEEQRPVYIKLNDGKPFLSLDIHDVLRATNNISVHEEILYQTREAVELFDDVTTSQGIRFDAITTPADYERYSTLFNRKRYYSLTGSSVVVIGSSEETKQPLVALSIPLHTEQNNTISAITNCEAGQSPVPIDVIKNAIDEYTTIINDRECNMALSDDIPKRKYDNYFRDYTDPDFLLDYTDPRFADTMQPKDKTNIMHKAEQIYGRDKSGALQIPSLQPETNITKEADAPCI